MVDRPGPARLRIGTAGWAVPARHAESFPATGSQLERYAARLCAVEINSSFYRPHRRTTYERWAASVPEDFRFAVKLPKTMSHERRLVGCEDLLAAFEDQVSGLGGALGVLLLQLPPSLAFAGPTAAAFLAALRGRFAQGVACEPRHPSWFASEPERLLAEHRVARVAADPAPAPGAGAPGGWPGLVYRRLHGAPRIYWSDYAPDALAAIAAQLAATAATDTWCIFDNTAAGHALGNALAVAGHTL